MCIFIYGVTMKLFFTLSLDFELISFDAGLFKRIFESPVDLGRAVMLWSFLLTWLGVDMAKMVSDWS
jgi:hypothetical protein